jgi:Peptidase family S51
VRRTVTLLGPQRRPSLQHVVRDLDPHAPVVTVTAGWLEREDEDAELQELLGGRAVNLGLHGRWLDVHAQDREFAHAERDHDAALGELRSIYLSQLDHALLAAYAVGHARETRPRLSEAAFGDAIDVIRLVDHQHLTRIRDAHQAFYAAWRPEERPAIAHHREEVRQVLTQAQVVVVAGGHVGELVRVLHLFHVEPHLPQVVIAWSAGAMALSERLVLFHDFVAHGVAQTEVFGEGLGVVRGLVPLPHMRRRLRTDDQVRMSVLARRFAPARCVVLDDGIRLPLTADGLPPPDARLLTEDGQVTEGAMT